MSTLLEQALENKKISTTRNPSAVYPFLALGTRELLRTNKLKAE